METMEKMETVETMETVKTAETMETTETAETMETMETMEKTETVETTETVKTMETTEKKTAQKKGRLFFDLVLILFLLMTAGAAFLFTRVQRDAGAVETGVVNTDAVVLVQIDGEEDARFPLNVDGVYTLHGGTNVLTVQDGWAWMSEADCPDHLCIRQGKIQSEGEWIVCLPNRVAITIEGG